MHVLRYGATRRQVLGVEAVFADGRVMRRLDGLEKDNTGYDLSGLLCGSEGTLAVITAARLRLVPRPTHVVVALLAFDDVDAALDARRRAAARGRLRCARSSCSSQRRPRPRVRAARARPAVRRPRTTRTCSSRRPPRTDPDRRARRPRSTRSPVSPMSRSRPTTAPPASSGATARRTPRRSTCSARRTSSTSRCPPTSSRDSSAEVRDRASRRSRPTRTVWLFGHAADGNMHVNVTGVAPDDERITDAVLRLVARRHGSISAEHGIGTAKRAWLSLVRTPAEIDAFRAIKRALDPDERAQPERVASGRRQRRIPHADRNVLGSAGRRRAVRPDRRPEPTTPAQGAVGPVSAELVSRGLCRQSCRIAGRVKLERDRACRDRRVRANAVRRPGSRSRGGRGVRSPCRSR